MNTSHIWPSFPSPPLVFGIVAAVCFSFYLASTWWARGWYQQTVRAHGWKSKPGRQRRSTNAYVDQDAPCTDKSPVPQRLLPSPVDMSLRSWVWGGLLTSGRCLLVGYLCVFLLNMGLDTWEISDSVQTHHAVSRAKGWEVVCTGDIPDDPSVNVLCDQRMVWITRPFAVNVFLLALGRTCVGWAWCMAGGRDVFEGTPHSLYQHWHQSDTTAFTYTVFRLVNLIMDEVLRLGLVLQIGLMAVVLYAMSIGIRSFRYSLSSPSGAGAYAPSLYDARRISDHQRYGTVDRSWRGDERPCRSRRLCDLDGFQSVDL
jgi:hypothetical protein